MAIELDAVSTHSESHSTGPVTLSFAHACSGSGRVLFVLTNSNAASVTGVQYAGVAMTRLVSSIHQVWYLRNPATGGATVVVTFAAPSAGTFTYAAVGLSYTGVSSWYPAAQQSPSGSTTPSRSVPSTPATTVLDLLVLSDNAGTTTPTAPQVEDVDYFSRFHFLASRRPAATGGALTTPIGWTFTTARGGFWLALALKPVAAGVGGDPEDWGPLCGWVRAIDQATLAGALDGSRLWSIVQSSAVKGSFPLDAFGSGGPGGVNPATDSAWIYHGSGGTPLNSRYLSLGEPGSLMTTPPNHEDDLTPAETGASQTLGGDFVNLRGYLSPARYFVYALVRIHNVGTWATHGQAGYYQFECGGLACGTSSQNPCFWLTQESPEVGLALTWRDGGPHLHAWHGIWESGSFLFDVTAGFYTLEYAIEYDRFYLVMQYYDGTDFRLRVYPDGGITCTGQAIAAPSRTGIETQQGIMSFGDLGQNVDQTGADVAHYDIVEWATYDDTLPTSRFNSIVQYMNDTYGTSFLTDCEGEVEPPAGARQRMYTTAVGIH